MKNTVDIDNLNTAFAFKSNKDLKYTYYIFKILQYPKLLKLLTACANGIIKSNLPLKFVIKNTIFKIFCAGETLRDAFGIIKKLDKFHVKSVLDYVSEGESTEAVFEKNANIITENIIQLGKECPGNYVSVKVSGLEDPLFLQKVNGHVFPTEPESAARFKKLYNRIDLICKTAHQYKVIVYIDAEDRNMQDILDALVEDMMAKYNKEEVIVFNTLQMYLKDRIAYLERVIKESDEKKYIPGIKLVRGAYVEKEREEARLKNIESPVFDKKEQTDASFNKALEICLSSKGKIYTCVATHNDQSTLLAVELINKYNIEDHNKKVKFSQLYGMSDTLTFNLAANGYNASKYLPYGEIKKAIPYLIRRAEENSSINGQITKELSGLGRELERRQGAKK